MAPESQIEQTITRLWHKVLGIETIGVNDDFFIDLGGDSLVVVQIQKALSKELGKSLSVNALFRYPTIRSLTNYICEQENLQDTSKKTNVSEIESPETKIRIDQELVSGNLSKPESHQTKIDPSITALIRPKTSLKQSLESKFSAIKRDFHIFTQSKNGPVTEAELDKFVQNTIMQKHEWFIIGASVCRDALVCVKEIDREKFQVVSIQLNSGVHDNENFRFPTPTIIHLSIKNIPEFPTKNSIKDLKFEIEHFYLSEFFSGTKSPEGICTKANFQPKIDTYMNRSHFFSKHKNLSTSMSGICHHLAEVFSYAIQAIESYLQDHQDIHFYTSASVYNADDDHLQIFQIDEFAKGKQQSILMDIPHYIESLKVETQEGDPIKSSDYQSKIVIYDQLGQVIKEINSTKGLFENTLKGIGILPLAFEAFISVEHILLREQLGNIQGLDEQIVAKVIKSSYCEGWA
jgi:acyl carrier protein